MKIYLNNFCSITLGLAFLISTIGCSSGDGFKRVAVQGSATFNGEPISNASFSMNPPVEAKDSPSVHGMIINGKYRLTRDRGPVPGPHRVDVTILGPVDSSDESDEGTKPKLKELGTYSIEITVPEKGSDSLNLDVLGSNRPSGTA
ncbi:MAG TPA: hypothetical protein VNQ76_11415 [Planctomicrobium sp.]|nr:hypothetical protein [Planctomicrobium sp.]